MKSASTATPITSTSIDEFGGRSSRDSTGGIPSSADRFQDRTAISPAAPPLRGAVESSGRRVTAVDALKTAQRTSLAELDALFATLQHCAFRGEL
jgi:type I restriction enzyme S subunit